MNALFAFIVSASIAASFRGPLRAVPGAGLAGMLGLLVHDALTHWQAPRMLAAFAGAFMIGAAGEWMARRLKEPVVLFVIPGLFPLVPGLTLYQGMLQLAREQLSLAGQTLTPTIFYAGALAAGLALPPTLLRRRK